jgi:hypothetical protein
VHGLDRAQTQDAGPFSTPVLDNSTGGMPPRLFMNSRELAQTPAPSTVGQSGAFRLPRTGSTLPGTRLLAWQ